ncbi:MAG: hypothetical protein JXB49_32165, partial [Bacteroidales bacterium]|nr:hypothetical protein [Bacteroidales bacterium]
GSFFKKQFALEFFKLFRKLQRFSLYCQYRYNEEHSGAKSNNRQYRSLLTSTKKATYFIEVIEIDRCNCYFNYLNYTQMAQ